MPPSSGGSLVRDTALGLGPVLLLWGAYLALQLSNEGRARCSPVYFAILAVQARVSAMGPSPCACISEILCLPWRLVDEPLVACACQRVGKQPCSPASAV